MPVERIGTCNRCGICCERLVEWQMTQVDPENPKRLGGKLHRKVCVYLDGKAGVGKTTTCSIISGDVDIDTIPEHHRAYHLKECLDYPDKDDSSEWDGSGPRGVTDVCAFIKIIIQD